MPEQEPVRYPLGSPSRRLKSLALLPVPFFLAWLILWAVVADFTSLLWANLSLVVPLLLMWMVPAWGALLWFGLDSKRSEDSDWHVPWFSDIEVSLAHGSAEENGIRFRKWFRWHFVTWKAIERVVFWPERHGRLDLHLFNRWGPLVFMPDGTTDTADYIARRLQEAWPRRSTFLVSIAKPTKVSPLLSKIGVGRKFLPILGALGIVCVYAVVRLSPPYDEFLHSKTSMAIGILGWVVWIVTRLFKKFRGAPLLRQDSAEVAAKKKLPS